MKVFYYYGMVAVAALLWSCQNSSKSGHDDAEAANHTQEANTVAGLGEISFAEEVYDFGETTEGEVVEHEFIFTNTGTEPVIIARVTTSCGCTSPRFTSTPVSPGKQGKVTVRFDSDGQHGTQQKIITVVSNAKNNIQTIQLKGKVS